MEPHPLEEEGDEFAYKPAYPTPDDPFKWGGHQNRGKRFICESPRTYNIEAMYRQGRALADKPGTRHIARTRAWVQQHFTWLDGTPDLAFVRQTFVLDDGYSQHQLEALEPLVSVLSAYRRLTALKQGLNVESSEVAQKLVRRPRQLMCQHRCRFKELQVDAPGSANERYWQAFAPRVDPGDDGDWPFPK